MELLSLTSLAASRRSSLNAFTAYCSWGHDLFSAIIYFDQFMEWWHKGDTARAKIKNNFATSHVYVGDRIPKRYGSHQNFKYILQTDLKIKNTLRF